MISGLDHVVVLIDDIAKGAANYEALLGCLPSWQYSGAGADRVLFTLDNVTVELVAPSGVGVAADHIRGVLKDSGEGLASLCFRTNDIGKMHRRLDRLALKPEPVAEVESSDSVSGRSLHWKRTRASSDVTRGVRLFFLELDGERPRSKGSPMRLSSGSTMSWSRPRTPSVPRRCMARGSASTWRSTARIRTGAS